ncbi:MAG: ParB N-terminal domain-containing protein [Gammaproteobacteria bacterium]
MNGSATEYPVHQAAELFPLMREDRYHELKESIRANGLREPITLSDEKILDGRNRYKACTELGIEPQFRTHEGDPFQYAWDLNGNRRDLTGLQRALIGLAAREKSEKWVSVREHILEAANNRRREAAEERPRDGGRFTSGGSTWSATGGGHPEREALADAFAVSGGDVARGPHPFRQAGRIPGAYRHHVPTRPAYRAFQAWTSSGGLACVGKRGYKRLNHKRGEA